MAVSPREARAGQAVTLQVSGTLCPGPRNEVLVEVRRANGGEDGAPPVASATFVPDAAGSWSGTLALPATLPAGIYRVGGACFSEARFFFGYVPVPQVVLTATGATVRFTG